MVAGSVWLPEIEHPAVASAFRSDATLFFHASSPSYFVENGVSLSFFNSTSSRLRRVADVFCGPLCDISPVDLDGYIQSSSTNAATRASVRAVVLGLFNFAQRKGWLKQDAATAASKAEKYKIPVREPEIFTPEQLELLLLHTRHNHDAQAVLIIGGMAGVRRAELQRMTWACWDREHNNLVLPPSITKTKRRRICSLEPAAQEWLAVLSEGKLPTDPKAEKPFIETPELTAARDKRDAARKQYREFLEANADAINIVRDRAAANRRLVKLNKLIDDAKKGKFPVKKDPRVKAADAKREAIEAEETIKRGEWDDMLFERALTQRSMKQVAWDKTKQVSALIRTVMLGPDFGAVGRQTGKFIVTRPKLVFDTIKKSFPAMKSDEELVKAENELLKWPDRKMYDEAGLEITQWKADKNKTYKNEEQFQGYLVEKMPWWLGGSVYRGTGRGQSVYLNRMRLELMDLMVATLSKHGDPSTEELRMMARFINVSTGRGDLAMWEKRSMEGLNTAFLAYRWMRSRFQDFMLQPLFNPWIREGWRRIENRRYRRLGMEDKVNNESIATWRATKVVAKEMARDVLGKAIVYTVYSVLGKVVWDSLMHGDDGEEEKKASERSSSVFFRALSASSARRSVVIPFFPSISATIALSSFSFSRSASTSSLYFTGSRGFNCAAVLPPASRRAS